MKKILLFIFLLFIPFMVKAQDVVIKEVTLVDSSNTVEADEHQPFEGLNINFNLKFTSLEEYAKYKVVIKNDTKKDYEIDTETKFSEGGYVKYEFTYEGKDIVKSKEEKEFYITITYNKEVPYEEFEDGKYTEKNSMAINLSEGEASSSEKNPYTASLPYVVILLAIVALILFVIAYRKKQALMFLIVLLFIMPIVLYALEKLSITLNTTIIIENDCKYKLVTKLGSFSYNKDVKEICVNELYSGNNIKLQGLSYMSGAPYYFNKVYFSTHIDVSKFKEGSYIRVYSNDTKEDLLVEINKDNIFNNMYGIGAPYYQYEELLDRIENSTLSWDLGNQNIDEIYVEVSDDLVENNTRDPYCQREGYDCSYFQPIKYHLETLNDKMIVTDYNLIGPFTNNQNIIKQISILEDNLGDLDQNFWGFTNCKIYEPGKSNECGGNIYYAKYGTISY